MPHRRKLGLLGTVLLAALALWLQHKPASVAPTKVAIPAAPQASANLPADLPPTLARIAAGRRLPFPDDGIVFQNREHRLPQQSRGYYREFVHPTPGERGPGARRVVTGADGDVWFTADHYRTFIRVQP